MPAVLSSRRHANCNPSVITGNRSSKYFFHFSLSFFILLLILRSLVAATAEKHVNTGGKGHPKPNRTAPLVPFWRVTVPPPSVIIWLEFRIPPEDGVFVVKTRCHLWIRIPYVFSSSLVFSWSRSLSRHHHDTEITALTSPNSALERFDLEIFRTWWLHTHTRKLTSNRGEDYLQRNKDYKLLV